MNDELKPCPFCGAPGRVEDTNCNNPSPNVRPLWEVRCSSCGYRSLGCVSPAERDESIVRWNTRPLEDALRTRAVADEAKLRAAVPAAPGPLERLEEWLRRSSKNHFEFERFNGAWVVRLYNYDVDCATSAPTLAATIDAALRQMEEGAHGRNEN